MTNRSGSGAYTCVMLVIYAITLVVLFWLSGLAMNTMLWEFAHKTIPFFWAGVVGTLITIVTGGVFLPVALIIWTLHSFGIF